MTLARRLPDSERAEMEARAEGTIGGLMTPSRQKSRTR
jgi:hypothetical protein